jgi:PAS domain S-box-containing protein
MSRVDPSEAFRPAETTVSREHLEAVLEQLPTPIVLIEPGSGLITFANRAADELAGGRFPRGTVDERMTGRPATDGAGQPLANADLPGMRIARGEQLRGARLEWRLPDRLLSLLVSGQIVTDGDGRDVGIVVFEDLGPMRAAERLRDESLALLDTIFESAPVGLALHGPDLRFLRVNRELASFNGISVEEHIGRAISELVPTVSPAVEESLRSVLETGRPITGVEISGETPGRRGVVQTWMCGWYPVRQGPEAEIVGVGAVVTEITERAALLEAERTARERAERAERQAAYLAEVGEILAGSLNWEDNLARVVRVSVRAKAQWCTVNLLQRDGTIRRLAGAHRDPAREHVLTELQRHYPLTIDDPVGAGSVLRSGRPELMREIDDEVLRSITKGDGHMALVQQLGMASRMIVPIVVRGRMTGTLTFARGPGERPYTLEDLRIVMEVARRASTGIAHAELYRERSHIAHTLQRSLLPPRLPAVPGMTIAARFRAAGESSEVGGDFYDLFPVDGAWMVVMGDVTGKGPEAAAITSLARYTMRTAAEYERSPAGVLERLNAALVVDPDRRRLCTVVCARIVTDPDGSAEVRVACGGHPPPFRLHDARAEPVAVTGPLLGAFEGGSWQEAVVTLEPGDSLVLYTDGVTDTRSAAERFGAERLEAVLAGAAGLEADEVADRVDRALLEFEQGPQRDDVALLVLRAGATSGTAAEASLVASGGAVDER